MAIVRILFIIENYQVILHHFTEKIKANFQEILLRIMKAPKEVKQCFCKIPKLIGMKCIGQTRNPSQILKEQLRVMNPDKVIMFYTKIETMIKLLLPIQI